MIKRLTLALLATAGAMAAQTHGGLAGLALPV
jgi:hypothetical protein